MRKGTKNKERSLIGACGIDAIDPPLIDIDEKDDVVAKASNAIHGGHANHEREDVVDERVEELVREHPPRQMRHRLQLVVDEQLRRHHDEAEH